MVEFDRVWTVADGIGDPPTLAGPPEPVSTTVNMVAVTFRLIVTVYSAFV
jgi:hypothetical protein